jgi:O-antigen ligase
MSFKLDQKSDPRIWLTLAGLAYVAAWLLPSQSQPWLVFHHEWLAMASFTALTAWLVWRGDSRVPVPAVAKAVALLALVPLAQRQFGQIEYAGDAWLAAGYLLALASAIVAGARWQRQAAPFDLPGFLFICCWAAATLSLALGLMQWLNIDSLGTLLLSPPPESRPVANIGQANQLGMLMVWGLFGIWGLRLRGIVRPALAWPAAFLLLVGLAMTQSRTGWLQVLFMLVLAVTLQRRVRLVAVWAGVLSLLVAYVALVLAWPSFNAALEVEGGLTLARQATAGPRTLIWHQLASALALHPWAGYGWTQVLLAQQAVPLVPGALHIPVNFGHNLVLDLMLWNGAPLGMAIALALFAFVLKLFGRIDSSDKAMLWGMVASVLIYAQFEFPLAYMYFLVPVGLMVGFLAAPSANTEVVRRGLPRAAALALVAVQAAVLALVLVDFQRMSGNYQAMRLETARIKTDEPFVHKDAWVFDQIGALVNFLRMPYAKPLSDEELAYARKLTRRITGPGLQYRMASMEAHSGQPQAAAKTLELLCAIQLLEQCRIALALWKEAAASEPKMALVKVPPDSLALLPRPGLTGEPVVP